MRPRAAPTHTHLSSRGCRLQVVLVVWEVVAWPVFQLRAIDKARQGSALAAAAVQLGPTHTLQARLHLERGAPHLELMS